MVDSNDEIYLNNSAIMNCTLHAILTLAFVTFCLEDLLRKRCNVIVGLKRLVMKLLKLKIKKLVFEHLSYAHFQKRTIEYPEFKGCDSFFVIPNKLVIAYPLSTNEIRDYTKNGV